MTTTNPNRIVTADTAIVGQEIKPGGRRAVVTGVRDGRIFFRYIVKGQLSRTERNTGAAAI